MDSSSLAPRVARELSLPARSVAGALELFSKGATLPFVARYRKEETGGLDEVQLRNVRDRAGELEALEERRASILALLEDRGLLDDGLKAALEGAETRAELEDLYRPHRPRRRTRGQMALERGLGPLADRIWNGSLADGELEGAAAAFVTGGEGDDGVADVAAALDGARDILAERLVDDPGLRALARNRWRKEAVLVSKRARGAADHPELPRFRSWIDHREPVRSAAGHRVLAIRRGASEGVLSWTLEGPEGDLLAVVLRGAREGRRAPRFMEEVARDATDRILVPWAIREVQGELEARAEAEAIQVFGQNLEQLLLQPPAGERSVLALDPGFRAGVKIAMVSAGGTLLDTVTLHLHREEAFRKGTLELVRRHRPDLVAVGNGTGSRETEAAVREALEEEGDPPPVVLVNEAGASVYSASEVAVEELPEVDVALRGAVSIGRRLQDPLAELVKIDPRSIGVGQYQHDVNQPALRTRLEETVEICVNRVGVELSTASPSLLSHVAGIGPTLATNIVEEREARGGFRSRAQLLEVPRLGPKAFQQAAGFLRLRDGSHPLDGTAVHPERYELVERMAGDLGVETAELVADGSLVDRLEARLERYEGNRVGRPTLEDIVAELRRPGRDPRETFEPPRFRKDVQKPADLKPGMVLQGVVTNVVAFGAFVDVGVHQDGLVHVSEMADRYVKDPATVVSVGQAVKVQVKSVDLDRGRIGLSMKTG
ncbi:MAG: RNA-binding transcriptional accessory protein [Gemmatimonadales bacterium]|nr:MAG: RNA-binding transcriptional accessory protein [Gemmatimonadales bacterium]